MSEKAKAAKREWARRYRQSAAGRERLAEAQNRYWEKKFDEFQAERAGEQDAGK